MTRSKITSERSCCKLTDRLLLNNFSLGFLHSGDAFFEHRLTTSLVNLHLRMFFLRHFLDRHRLVVIWRTFHCHHRQTDRRHHISRITHYYVCIGARARKAGGPGCSPLTRAKPLFFRQKLIFFGQKPVANKKLSYRRETARQLPTWRGARPSSPPPYTYAYGRIRNTQRTYDKLPSSTKRTLRWIGHSRSFKVILIRAGRNAERCVVVMCN